MIGKGEASGTMGQALGQKHSSKVLNDCWRMKTTGYDSKFGTTDDGYPALQCMGLHLVSTCATTTRYSRPCSAAVRRPDTRRG
jgi:hypothetical protein